MKKTRIKLDSENSLFVVSHNGKTGLYKMNYDYCVLAESEEEEQEYCIMIFYNNEALLLQSVVNKKTIEKKFSLILNKHPIVIYSQEVIYINSANPKVKTL